jgi:phenylacetate-CoA ligase
MPLAQLVALCEERFRQSRVMERSARSALYRERWAAAGVVPAEVCDYASLRRHVPYTTGSDLKRAQAQFPPGELLCTDRQTGTPAPRARLWISTSGTTGVPKWIPLGEGDVMGFTDAAARLMGVALDVTTQEWSMLYINGPAPFFSEASGYFTLGSQLLHDRNGELTFVALPETFDALDFSRRMRPQGLFAFPSLALLIAERVSSMAAPEAKALFRQEPSLRNLLGVIVTSLVKIKARHVFKFKWGMFAGEPVEPYRQGLEDSYGLRATCAYGASEFTSSALTECRAQDGLHLYLDTCLPEIIPVADLEREEVDPSFAPQAIPIWEAVPGSSGELVITSFSDALPMVRYRTSDLIRLVSLEPCGCGRTSPRIRILHRSDDIVNLGLVRFSIYELKAKLEAIAQHAEIARWQLRVTREQRKPKAVLLVEPSGQGDAQALVKQIRDRMDELKGFRQAWQNGLISEPEVRLVERIEEQRTSSGKIKLAIYEDAYFRGTQDGASGRGE